MNTKKIVYMLTSLIRVRFQPIIFFALSNVCMIFPVRYIIFKLHVCSYRNMVTHKYDSISTGYTDTAHAILKPYLSM